MSAFPDSSPVDRTNWDEFERKRREGAFSVYRFANQAASAANPTKATFDTVEYNYGGWDSTNNRWIAPFDCIVALTWAANANPGPTTYLETCLRKNGVDWRFPTLQAPVSSLAFTGGASHEKLKAGDFMELWAYWLGGASLTLIGSGTPNTPWYTYFQGHVVARL